MTEVAIGIDLGTTYSCMAVIQNGNVSIIENELGEKTTPSYVHIDEDGYPVIGKPAKTQCNLDPATVIFDVKRLIGRRFNDPAVQKDTKLWPFKVIDERNIPKLSLRGKSYHPEEISAKILAHFKSRAEKYLRLPVTKAVITVPAYFNNGQREATKDAGEIAGLEVLRILNEPTAAALAYWHTRPTKTNQNIVVFDLGGGTFDVSVLSIEGGKVNTIGVGGDTHLGGEDIDRALVEYCLSEFQRRHNFNLSEGKNSGNEEKKRRALRILKRLKIECEDKKCFLTTARKTVISLDAVHGEIDLAVEITRDKFNSMNESLFQKCIDIMDKTLRESNLLREEVDDVLLVGGSSRIPKLQEMITKYFGKQPSLFLRGDEAVAHGAAILASMLVNNGRFLTQEGEQLKVNFQDVVPFSIGISAFLPNSEIREFFPIIQKNSPVPCTHTKKFETRMNNQRILVRVFEGEHKDPDKNFLLGEFAANHLPVECPAGEPYWVHMNANAEGVLQVTITYRGTGSKDKFVLEANKGRLRKEEVQQLKRTNTFLENIVA